MLDFLIEVRASWGHVSKWLVRDCEDSTEAKNKLQRHYENHMHVELSVVRSSEGYHIYHTTQISESKEVIEVCDESTDD